MKNLNFVTLLLALWTVSPLFLDSQAWAESQDQSEQEEYFEDGEEQNSQAGNSEEEEYEEEYQEGQPAEGNGTKRTFRKGRTYKKTMRRKRTKGEHRHYLTNHEPRTDSGVFHVAIAAGGNFYVEPKVDATTNAPLGDYFKDFGFQAGVYFDWDYSELEENIPLALRGMVGYKYILSSVHVFTFDGVIRNMWRMSQRASFGVGMGFSAAVWFRQANTDTTDDIPDASEEIIFLPSFIATAGFDFNPFLADFKFLVNRIGEDTAILGFELYFGLRL